MLGIGKVGTVIVGLLGAGVLAIIGLGYVHYTSVLSDRVRLEAENRVLETAVETQHGTIDAQAEAIRQWQEAQETMRQTLEEAARVGREAADETRRLNDTLSRNDLGRLTRGRPSLVEDRVNRGTSRTLRLLECATDPGRPGCAD